MKTSSLLEAQSLRQNPGLNSTMGFRLSYQQMRDCDKNESDLAGPPTINNLLQTFSMNGGFAPPLFRNGIDRVDIDPGAQQLLASVIAAPDANPSVLHRLTNSSVEVSDSDNIWDYLESSEESGSMGEDDVYDFL